MIKAILQSALTALVVVAILPVLYSVQVANYTDDMDRIEKAEAIIVLTGGTNRIEEGLKLLRANKAPFLYISGTHPDTTIADITGAETQYDCCITLDHIANSTETNALRTADWIKEMGYQSIILVTSNYHMPRALIEFKNSLPETVSIQAYGVTPAPESFSYLDWNTWHVYLLEGMKYWGAWLKLYG